MNAPRLLAALALAALLLTPSTALGKALDEQVEVVDGGDLASWGYSPSSLTVPAGTTVTWRNTGSQVHGITSQDQLFDSHLLDTGRSWSYTFDEPGTYRYFCVPHPWMKGVVVVTAVEEPTPRPTSTATPRAGDEPTPRATATPTPDDDNASPRRGMTPSPTTITPTRTATPTVDENDNESD